MSSTGACLQDSFEESLNTTLLNLNFCPFFLPFYKIITDGETGQASCSQLEVLTDLSCVLRTEDPNHFDNSEFYENFYELELPKIYYNQTKNSIKIELDF